MAQNMNQANIALLPQWRAAGNTGDMPVGWNGPPSASDIIAQQKSAQDANNAAQEAKQSDFITRFKAAVSGLPSLQQSATDIGSKLGLPDLTKNAQSLTANVAAIPTNQTNATRGFDVNATQLGNIIAQKQKDLAPIAQTAVTQEQNAESELGKELGYQQAQNAQTLLPIQTEGTMLSSQIAAEMTGFSKSQDNELNVLLEQIKEGNANSQADLDRAEKLAEAKINNQKTEAALQKLSPGETLVDATGKVIYQAPKATSTGGGNYYSTPTAINGWS